MPKIYSEIEKFNINKSLIEYAESCLFHKGVASTTIDEIIKEVNIPKGTFYLFYESKESLFFNVLISFRKEMEEKLSDLLLNLDENHIVTSLTKMFSFLIIEVYRRGIYRIYDHSEYALISRKLKIGVLESEKEELFNMFKKFFSYFSVDNNKDLEKFFTSYMLLNYSLLHSKHFDNIEESLTLIIRGLILQLVGE